MKAMLRILIFAGCLAGGTGAAIRLAGTESAPAWMEWSRNFFEQTVQMDEDGESLELAPLVELPPLDAVPTAEESMPAVPPTSADQFTSSDQLRPADQWRTANDSRIANVLRPEPSFAQPTQDAATQGIVSQTVASEAVSRDAITSDAAASQETATQVTLTQATGQAIDEAPPAQEVRDPRNTTAEAPQPKIAQNSSNAGNGSEVSPSMLLEALDRLVKGTATESDAEPVSAPAAIRMTPGSGSTRGENNPIRAEGDETLSMTFRDADIRQVLDQLAEQGGLNLLASRSVQGNISASLTNVTVASALEAVLKMSGYVARREGDFIYIGTPRDFDDVELALDRVGTRIYRPNYVTATELSNLITPLLTEGIGKASVTTPSEVGIGSDDSAVGGDSHAGSEALVIQDYEGVLDELDQIVRELDKRPLQVAIEAMILSVRLNDTYRFGVDFELLRNQNHIRLATGTPGDSLAQLSFEDGGLQFGFLDSSLGAFLDALETIGDTNVIATPRLLCLNKQRAEILIGSELGYVSTTYTETSSSQNVEFLEVGAQLRLRPFISSDGLIRMEVHPELSTGNVRIEGGFTLPDKDLTQVTTNVMVRDSCTVIIGGLMREDLTSTTSQVPLLGSLPVVGPAFRHKDEEIERREILVLLTPRIVYEPGTCCEGEQGKSDFYSRQAEYTDHMSPIGKVYLGRKYLRLAEEAWAQGDAFNAMRYVEKSVHFDPLNNVTLKLRREITAAACGHAEFGSGDASVYSTAPLEGESIAPWLLQDLQQGVLDEGVSHPLDPGRPGRRVDVERRTLFHDDVNQ